MGYRRDGEGQRGWKKWIERHRDTIIKAGLPEFVYSDEMTWLRFLEHGGWHHEPRWGVKILSPKEASILSDFIRGEYGGEEYRHLLKDLDDVRRKSGG